VVIVDPPYTVASCRFQSIDILELPYETKVSQEHHEYELSLLCMVRFKKPYECETHEEERKAQFVPAAVVEPREVAKCLQEIRNQEGYSRCQGIWKHLL